MRGWAGPAPCPLPLLRWRSCWGGGGVAGRVLPGDFEQGRGEASKLKWQIFLVSKFGGLFSRVNPAGCHGKIFWRVILAHLFSRFFIVNETSKLQCLKKRKRKEKGKYNQWICKLHHEHCI